MTAEWNAVLAVGTTLDVAILGFLVKMTVDFASLRERMVRLEGLFEGFTERLPEKREV